MGLPRMGSPRGATSRRVALWSALAVGGILPSVGCQVEYAGMTLPSGKYMHDDVQYFPAGPEFPWANTQAATQRARMRAMGIEPPPPAVSASHRAPVRSTRFRTSWAVRRTSTRVRSAPSRIPSCPRHRHLASTWPGRPGGNLMPGAGGLPWSSDPRTGRQRGTAGRKRSASTSASAGSSSAPEPMP